MKKLVLYSVVLLLFSCGGVKKTQEAVNSGNYMAAMNKAIKNLAENKTRKGNQAYIVLLEDAFAKNAQREQEQITFLEQDGNPSNLETIYNKYVQLKNIQNRIRPLMPLRINDEGRDANFRFMNYDNAILETKDDLSDYLYVNASDLLKSAKYKQDYRNAYNDFQYLQELSPGFKDTVEKMDEAYQKGLDYVKVQIENETEQVIPERLEEELLDFNTFGIDNFWTKFHSSPMANMKYDYALNLGFREINISPERVNETQIIKEKQIKDGYEYLLDENGNAVKDSLGNRIKVDRLRTVQCNFYQFTQFKSAQIGAKVSITDLDSGQEVNSYPLSSEFVFEHIYANYKGDRRALDNDLVALLDLAAVPFPTNEQMVYDAGEDLKARLKNIVRQQQFQ
ncbi:hypothetical protein [Flagellimonas allohymeniacidonis]|uniref:Lipoprotein n=1 Tax=Flagellimonas allohymeniacidonis TaxID=2517819 RepID=A0A4Q8QEW8_9FLAO|nr:hypothetical protein [Allomuricauda hymeniacidonis]TAI49042.1 hypothetical protein EW142_04410 [Allomuricauda hymeniacidonis]